MKEVNVTILIPENSKDKVFYRLLDDITFHGYTIPKGFITDGASVPRIAWSLLPPVHEYFPASILHDWMLSTGEDRKVCDDVFRESMIEMGINKYRANIMYYAVRAYSRIKYG